VADRWLGARRSLAFLASPLDAVGAGHRLLQPGMPPLVLGVLVVFGASAIGWNSSTWPKWRARPRRTASLATGGTLAVTFFGVVLGPPAFGALAALFASYRAGFFAPALATACCALALLRRETNLAKPRRDDPGAAAATIRLHHRRDREPGSVEPDRLVRCVGRPRRPQCLQPLPRPRGWHSSQAGPFPREDRRPRGGAWS
jgi:MFS family permease